MRPNRVAASVCLIALTGLLGSSLSVIAQIDTRNGQGSQDLSNSDLRDMDELLSERPEDDATAGNYAAPDGDGVEDSTDSPEETTDRYVPLYSPKYEEEENSSDDAELDEETEQESAELINQPAVLLRGSDKITGRTTDLHLAIDEEVIFGGLRLTVKACHQTPPTEPPESIAYLEIDQFGFKVDDEERAKARAEDGQRFSGWMYASSPGVNSLEDPIYDVWVIRCMAELPDTSESGSES